MEFWIKDEKGRKDILLPVTPSSYEFTVGNDIEVVRATQTGDIFIPANKRPENITLKGFFPAWNYDFCQNSRFNADTPMDYVNQFKKWIDKKLVVRVVIADEDDTKVNERFYVESITYSEDQLSNKDINYTISLKKCTKVNVPTIKTSSANNVGTNNARAETKEAGRKTHTVKKGEYLCLIARKYYGNNNWQKIYNANKNVIGKNPNLIYPGQVLIIP